MSDQRPVMPPQFHTLTLEDAKNRTRYWREAIAPLYGTDPEKMPHGFFIHKDDIRELAKLHEYLHEEIEGVRVYFSFDKEQKLPYPPGKYPDGIRGILVPVYLGTAGTRGTAAGDNMLMDLIIDVESETESKIPLEQKVSVFDVTQPCPPICDSESPLFGK